MKLPAFLALGILLGAGALAKGAAQPQVDTPGTVPSGDAPPASPEEKDPPELEPGEESTPHPEHHHLPPPELQEASPDHEPEEIDPELQRYIDTLRAQIQAQKERDDALPPPEHSVDEDGAPPPAPSPEGRWRLSISSGPQFSLAASVQWIGSPLVPEIAASVERNLGDVQPLPGLGLALGIAFRAWGNDGSHFFESTDGPMTRPLPMRAALTEWELGVTYHWPHEGFGGIVFPYTRVDALLGWGAVTISDLPANDVFIPGVAGALGVRLALPPMGRSGTRLFFSTEARVTYRAATMMRLYGGHDPEAPIADPGVPLGTLELSGYGVRLGFGVEF